MRFLRFPMLAPGVLAAVLAAGAATAQTPHDLLVLVSGNDTVSVERFVRTPSRLEAEMLIRAANARFTYAVDLGADAGATRFENAFRQATADTMSPPVQRASVRFTGDSAIADITGNAGTVTQRFATRPGAIPFINPSFALVELVLQRARRMGGDSAAVPLWLVQGGTTVAADVVRRGGDSVTVRLGGVALHLAVNAAGEIEGGVIPSQGLRLYRVRGGSAGALHVEKPDYSAPPSAPYTAEDVRIPTRAGHILAGTLTLPKGGNAPVAAVVTITGSGPQDRDEAISLVKGYRPFRQVADTLGRHGIAVLRMDDRGTGESGGNFATATSRDFADDIRAGITWLRGRREIDPSRLALVGHSEGGLIAPMIAADDSTLRAIVLLAGPAQDGRTILRYQFGNAIRGNRTLTPAQRDSALTTVDASIDSLAAQAWVRFFLDYDPLETARRVRTPALVLHGATDRQVTAEQAEVLAQALRAGGNRDVTSHVFPEANHLFVHDPDGTPAGYGSLPTGAVRSDVLGTLLDWLRVRLGK